MSPTLKSPKCPGIFQSDIVVRTAIIAALDDIRANPWNLDFVFQWLLHDELTLAQYGYKELEDSKNWILNNQIEVSLGYNYNNIKIPHIVIWQGEGSETQQILGDVSDTNPEHLTFFTQTPPTLTITPVSYDSETGIVTIAESTEKVFVGQRLLDRVNNTAYLIEDVPTDNTIQIPADSQPNLKGAEVVNASDLWVASLESVKEQETFTIDCVVQGDATKAIILRAVVLYILLKYKQDYLEARGFENTVWRNSPIGGAQGQQNQGDATQIFWKRSITLTGTSTHYWPKHIRPPLQGILPSILIPASGVQPYADPPNDQAWNTIEDEDSLAQS